MLAVFLIESVSQKKFQKKNLYFYRFSKTECICESPPINTPTNFGVGKLPSVCN